MFARGAVDPEYMRLDVPRAHYPRAVLATLATLSVAAFFAFGTAAVAPAAPRALAISGAGDGHGVGMSQQGALGYAQHGYGYAAILAHYYTGTTLGTVPAGTSVRVLLHGRVRKLGIEAYVRGVVGAEMPASWPLAALEAQAVASRTYALTDHAGGARFDVYADTRSQVYRGVKAQTAQTDAAVAATAGQIVTYAGRPAITYFFASSGGATEDVQYGFPGATPEPWLVGVPDPFEQAPADRWSVTIALATAGARLRGSYRGTFEGVQVLRRGYSPRIVTAAVLGSGGSGEISGAELAGRLGLPSTWAYFSLGGSAHGTGTPASEAGAVPGPTGGAPASET